MVWPKALKCMSIPVLDDIFPLKVSYHVTCWSLLFIFSRKVKKNQPLQCLPQRPGLPPWPRPPAPPPAWWSRPRHAAPPPGLAPRAPWPCVLLRVDRRYSRFDRRVLPFRARGRSSTTVRVPFETHLPRQYTEGAENAHRRALTSPWRPRSRHPLSAARRMRSELTARRRVRTPSNRRLPSSG